MRLVLGCDLHTGEYGISNEPNRPLCPGNPLMRTNRFCLYFLRLFFTTAIIHRYHHYVTISCRDQRGSKSFPPASARGDGDSSICLFFVVWRQHRPSSPGDGFYLFCLSSNLICALNTGFRQLQRSLSRHVFHMRGFVTLCGSCSLPGKCFDPVGGVYMQQSTCSYQCVSVVPFGMNWHTMKLERATQTT